MTEAHFAAIGAFAMFAVAVLVIGFVAIVLVDSVKNWLGSRSELLKNVARVMEAQTMLMKLNNNLNERVKALEEERELRGDAE